MTEQQWLASAEPAAMLAWLNNAVRGVTYDNPVISAGIPVASPRKLRLFACACCRQPAVWSRLVDDVACYGCRGSGTLKVKRRGPGPEPKKTYIVDPPGFPCPDCSGTGRINRSRRAVEVAERFADGLATAVEMREAWLGACSFKLNSLPDLLSRYVSISPDNGFGWMSGALWTKERWAAILPPATQADLLRHIVGNPFREVKEPSRWVDDPQSGKGWSSLGYREHVLFKPTPLVLDLAQQLYDGRDVAPILHDALIDGGAPEEFAGHFKTCKRCGGTGECGPSWDGEDSSYLCRCGGKQCHPKGCAWLDTILGKE